MARVNRGVRSVVIAGVIAAGACLGSVAGASADVPRDLRAGLVVAQAYGEQQQQSRSTRVSGRGIKGLVKLGIGAVALLFVGGSWVYRKATGGGQASDSGNA